VTLSWFGFFGIFVVELGGVANLMADHTGRSEPTVGEFGALFWPHLLAPEVDKGSNRKWASAGAGLPQHCSAKTLV
jgi:hypothetical protein